MAGLFFFLSLFFIFLFGYVHPSGMFGLALLQSLNVIDIFEMLIYILYLKK